MYQLYYDSPLTLEAAATTKLVRSIFMGVITTAIAAVALGTNISKLEVLA